jgi:multicomponent Na+:H+ antiporter subunit G
MNNIIGTGLIIIGLVFDLTGSMTLIRFKNSFARLKASMKCITLGTFLILLGTFVIKGFSPTGIKAMVAGLLLLFISAVSMQAIGHVMYKRNER